MFTFKSLELMNWDFWPHFHLPFGERIIMLAGPNGSGKTTFLDSLRLLLGARQLSTGRKLSKYLRSGDRISMVKGVVTNTARPRAPRPFQSLNVVQDEATLVCLLENKSGTWEKRYAILDGNVPVEQIRQHKSWMGVEDYCRHLHAAGLPRTLLKILALEQGETNKLCQKTPAELMRYLLEIQGDKATIDRYSDALENYRVADRELQQQEQKAAASHLNVLEHEKLATQAEQFHAKSAELLDLSTRVLPRAQYKDVKTLADQLAALVGIEESKLNALADRRAAVLRELSELADQDSNVGTLIESYRAEASKISRGKEVYDIEYGNVSGQLSGLEKLRADAQGIEPEDIDGLVGQIDERRRAADRFEDLYEQRAARVNELVSEARQLEGQRGVQFPNDVLNMRRALEEAGIRHVLMAEMIEIREPHWQVAVESVLGGSRLAIVVDPSDSLEARRIAQKQKYRYFVTQFESQSYRDRPARRSALEVVDLARADLPRWIIDSLNRVTLVQSVDEGMRLGRGQTSMTPDGYRQDDRGGVHAGTDRLYCGRGAAADRLRTVQTVELPEASAQRDHALRERDGARRTLLDLQGRLSRQKKRIELQEKEANLAGLVARHAELQTIRAEMTAQFSEANQRAKQLEQSRAERLTRRGELMSQRDSLDRERQNIERALPGTQQKALRERELLRRLESDLPAEDRTDEALRDLPPRATVESLVERLKREVDGWTGCKDLAAREIYVKIRDEFEGTRQFLEGRRSEHKRWIDELSEARRAYKRVVEQTVSFYRTAVEKLAQKAGFQIQIPVLDLPEGDDAALERAELRVRVAYDGKRFVPIDDPDLSGGQSVLTSLVLLLGMTFADGSEENSGFFILDEPFAHLSVERIDDVAAFLSATNSQFILTTPTTHNHNVFNPSHMTIALRKKLPAEKLAPSPVFIRR